MNRPHPETLEVNQSAFESRIVKGMKYSSTCWEERSAQILLRDSTACGRKISMVTVHLVLREERTLSRTTGSSMAARFSRGDRST